MTSKAFNQCKSKHFHGKWQLTSGKPRSEMNDVYDPLDYENLAKSIVNELLQGPKI